MESHEYLLKHSQELLEEYLGKYLAIVDDCVVAVSSSGHDAFEKAKRLCPGKEWDRLVTHLMETGIEILVSWSKPMHHHDALGLKHFHLPKTEQISNEVLSLPMYPELSDEQMEFVVEAFRNFYEE